MHDIKSLSLGLDHWTEDMNHQRQHKVLVANLIVISGAFQYNDVITRKTNVIVKIKWS